MPAQPARPGHKMTHITRAAAQHTLALDPVHRRAVVDHLLEPQPADDCTPVHGRGGTLHYRVNGSLRVSFVRRCDRVVVVHVGLHPAFDVFAKGKGALSISSAVTIEEFVARAESVKVKKDNRETKAANQLVGGLVAAFSQTIEKQLATLRDESLVECFFEVTADRLEKLVQESLERAKQGHASFHACAGSPDLALLGASVAENTNRLNQESERLAILETKCAEAQSIWTSIGDVREGLEAANTQFAAAIESQFNSQLASLRESLAGLERKLHSANARPGLFRRFVTCVGAMLQTFMHLAAHRAART